VATGRGHPLVAASDPVWSPAGRTIAFEGVREKRGHGYAYDLYTVSANGTSFTALRTGRGYPFRPAWSPDGTEIAFSRYGHGVSLIHPNGTGETHLNRLPGSACCLAWNPSP
jgi:Tol biopolymer transport system component